ncbi:hypothetical protein [Xanthomonas translucens]|uniref:hypothetical protein n=1 Tax=Xanthomonas campestris pv. translucens TaxID=343 RepID=UPI00071B4267|nr:hypothetical protein [Xanthomonas translucens]MCT8281795.1 hypothetical protein [Xanthomonas translucens pv. undulosa]MCT8316451.1 hypothetical protein [Xanthomonas translucens pv. undulosa]UKE38307.1 hypothetical protein KCU58_11075 [Xanthomonas translucens pv. undulosa]
MSAQILQFPIQDSYDKHQVSHVHKLAVELGHDPKQAVRDFIAAGCPQQTRNELAERARRARMHNPDDTGPEAA